MLPTSIRMFCAVSGRKNPVHRHKDCPPSERKIRRDNEKKARQQMIEQYKKLDEEAVQSGLEKQWDCRLSLYYKEKDAWLVELWNDSQLYLENRLNGIQSLKRFERSDDWTSKCPLITRLSVTSLMTRRKAFLVIARMKLFRFWFRIMYRRCKSYMRQVHPILLRQTKQMIGHHFWEILLVSCIWWSITPRGGYSLLLSTTPRNTRLLAKLVLILVHSL